jgi:hypothetical protein
VRPHKKSGVDVREVVRDGCIIPPFPPPRAKNASIGVTIVRAMSERDQGESRTRR